MSVELGQIAKLLPQETKEQAAFAQKVADLATEGRKLGIPERVLPEQVTIFTASEEEKVIPISSLVEQAFTSIPETQAAKAPVFTDFGQQFNRIVGGKLNDETPLKELYLKKDAPIPSILKRTYHRMLNALQWNDCFTVGSVRELDHETLMGKRNIGTSNQEFILEAFKQTTQHDDEDSQTQNA